MSLRKAKQNTQEYCQNTLTQVGNGEYDLVGKYLNQDTYITLKHASCQHTFSTTLGLFKSGKRCPRCEESKNDF